MDDQPLFISDNQRDCLKEAYDRIKKIQSDINLDYEEYSAIKTTLYYLKNAIKYKERES